jgi:hypothetical protein
VVLQHVLLAEAQEAAVDLQEVAQALHAHASI